jgi:pilus assembly protein CpaC
MTFIRFNLSALAAAAMLAAPTRSLFAQSAEDLRLTVGKSVVIDYPSDIRQISTSDPGIVDASPVTTREILLNGKGLGTATMVVWSKEGQRTFYNISVEINLDPLRRLLKESFPSENIDARSSRDSISLNGTVTTKEIAERAAVLAAGFGKTVVNNIQIGPGGIEKQVLLRVKFALLDRLKSTEYGVNIVSLGATNTIGRVTTGQFTPPTPTQVGGNSSTFSITDALNIFAFRPDLNLAAFIKALQAENILQILAEPNLVTANGKEANFLVGGEFPVPILQGGANSGAVTVQFREFGIRLSFTPNITANNTIKVYVRQEVSTLDLAHGVQLSGFLIPALATRRAETNVELSDGQTFVVAGLLNNQESEVMSKLPVISSIPILGTLFKSKKEEKESTELVLMITPEVTEPLAPTDTKPSPAFPNGFIQRIDPKALAEARGNQADIKKGGGAGRKK